MISDEMFAAFIRKVRHEVGERRAMMAENIILGSVKDYTEYREFVGEITAYDWTLEILNNAVKRMSDPVFEEDDHD